MKEYIIDASVGIKWILDEENSDKAAEFLALLDRKEIKIVVPEFFYCEIGSAFWKSCRNQKIMPRDAVEGMGWVLGLQFERRLDSEFADVALENALHYGITIYDSLYVSLAETYLAPLVTADEKLIKACRSKGFDFIESLEEVKMP